MKIIKESFSFLSEDISRTCATLLQLIIFIVAASVSLGALVTTNYYVRKAEKSHLDNYVYFSMEPYYTPAEQSAMKAKLTDELGVAYTPVSPRYYQVSIENGEIADIQCYNSEGLRNMDIDLYRGNTPDELNANECLISYDIYKKYGCRVNDVISVAQGSEVFKLKISGIVKQDESIPGFTRSGTAVKVKNLYDSCQNTIITYALPRSESGAELMTAEYHCGFIEVPEGADAKMVSKRLAPYGRAHTFEEMARRDRAENRDMCIFFMTFAVVILLVGLVGIGANNFLVLEQHERVLAVYYMSGMAWGDCFKLLLLRNAWLIIISGVLSSGVTMIMSQTVLGNDFTMFAGITIPATAFLFAAVFLSSLPVYFRIKSMNPIYFFKGEKK